MLAVGAAQEQNVVSCLVRQLKTRAVALPRRRCTELQDLHLPTQFTIVLSHLFHHEA